MKAVLTMPNRSYHKLSAVYHPVWDSIHTEKMARIADKTFSICLTLCVITGVTSLFSTVIAQLGGRVIITYFCDAMSKVIYMGF
jgi:hypothetical protein